VLIDSKIIIDGADVDSNLQSVWDSTAGDHDMATASNSTAGAPTMTASQKFMFDLRGWLLLPAVLTPGEVESCRRHVLAIHANPPVLPEHERNSFSGPCQELLDHPAVVAVLREIIAPDLVDPMWRADETRDFVADRSRPSLAYGFRCDNSFTMIRSADPNTPLGPHNGGPAMGPSHHYQVIDGRILSPSVRVVWELTDVPRNGGGTPFLSGSHKSHFNVPAEHLQRGSPGWESYECPAGSVVLFSENVCHGSAAWTNTAEPRMAVFNHYMHYGMRFHRTPPPPAAIDAMPPLRRTLFRDVWMFEPGEGGFRSNAGYSPGNRARAHEA
jgi:hypothetical protein